MYLGKKRGLPLWEHGKRRGRSREEAARDERVQDGKNSRGRQVHRLLEMEEGTSRLYWPHGSHTRNILQVFVYAFLSCPRSHPSHPSIRPCGSFCLPHSLLLLLSLEYIYVRSLWLFPILNLDIPSLAPTFSPPLPSDPSLSRANQRLLFPHPSIFHCFALRLFLASSAIFSQPFVYPCHCPNTSHQIQHHSSKMTKAWAENKSHILAYYETQKLPLNQVMVRMAQHHGFRAS